MEIRTKWINLRGFDLGDIVVIDISGYRENGENECKIGKIIKISPSFKKADGLPITYWENEEKNKGNFYLVEVLDVETQWYHQTMLWYHQTMLRVANKKERMEYQMKLLMK